MIQIRIEGFQAIQDATLEVKGITCVVGPTNSGKSAGVRAIEAALYSLPGSDFVTWGKSQSRVTIDFTPQHHGSSPLSIIWEKPLNSSATYTIDGVDYRKTGKVGPRDILTKSGLRELIVRNEKYRVNFWRQLEQPFLIFESPTLAFEIIAAVFHQTDLTSLLKSMSKDLQDLKDDTLRLEGQLESNKAMVETQKGIYDSFLEDMQHYPLYETLLSEVKGLTALQDTMQDLSAKTAEISKVDNYLAPLQELLSRSNGIMQNIEPLVTDLQVLNELASDWDQSSLDAFKIRNGLSSTTDLLSSLAPTLTQLEAQIEETKSLMMFYNEANRLSQDTHTKQTVLDRCQEDLKAYLDELSGFDICPLCQQNLTGHDHAASSTPEI